MRLNFQVILGEYDQLSTGYYPPDSYHAIDVIRHPLYRNAMRFRENGTHDYSNSRTRIKS